VGWVNQVNDVAEAQERQGYANPQPLDLREFREICELSMMEPQWRYMADKACDYIDGNQLSAADRELAQSRGLPDITANLMAPVINVVLGMEERARLDWRVMADSSDDQDTAEALSVKMKEAERESKADRARSDAYASQIKSGMGWVEIGRNSDPFKYWLRAENIHRREIWWDHRDPSPTLENAQWQIRKKQYDINHLAAFFPGKEELIRAYGAGWDSHWLRAASESLELSQAYDQERTTNFEFEARDPYRKTVMAYEVAYRRWCRGYVIFMDERPIEVDVRNPIHQSLIASGRVKPVLCVYSKVFRSLWVGPHKLVDRPYRHRRLPYIPFFGYREDLTGAPYGLGRSMMPLQDEINARRNKLMALLSGKRVVMDNDALDQNINSISKVLSEISKANGVVVLNKDRQNKDGFAVEHQTDLSTQQMQVMEEAKQSLQQVVGVFNAMLGREQSAQSGVAISGLVEQSNQGLAEINGNYRFSSQEMGQAILDEIRYKIGDQPVQVQVGERSSRRTISLNSPATDPKTGLTVLMNDVQRAQARLALADVPSTPAYRQEQLRMINEVASRAVPPIQAALMPFLIEMTDISNRHDMSDAVRQALKMPPPMSDDQKEQAQVAAEQEAAVQKELQARVLDAQIREAEANATKAEADAVKAQAEAGIKTQDFQYRDAEEQRTQESHEREGKDKDMADINALSELAAAQEAEA
jgi:hypothetical protein